MDSFKTDAPARSFSVRVMAAECHRQMLFATFFSTQNFAGAKSNNQFYER
jgi:hypothetical protein